MASRLTPLLVPAIAALLSACMSDKSMVPAVQAGRTIAEENCAECHGIGRLDESPLEQAPPFRRLNVRYPAEYLAEAFAQGIVIGHADMPAFVFDQGQITALIAYLKSL